MPIFVGGNDGSLPKTIPSRPGVYRIEFNLVENEVLEGKNAERIPNT